MRYLLRSTKAITARAFFSLLCSSIVVTGIALSQELPWYAVGPWGGEVHGLGRVGSTLLAGGRSAQIPGTLSAGLFISTNNGMSWTRPIVEPATWGATSFASHGSTVIAFGEEAARSTDGGLTWRNLDLIGPPMWMAFAGDTLIGVIGGSLYRSIDLGDTWEETDSTPSGVINRMTPHNGAIYLTTTKGIHRSNDGGDSWTPLAPITGNSDARAIIVTDQVIIASAASNPFATTESLVRSTDGGATWISAQSGITAERIGVMAQTGNDIYAAGDDHGELYRTTDNGAAWSAVPTSFPYPIAAMIASGDTLFLSGGASSIEGIYRSTNRGATWSFDNNGFTTIHVNMIEEVDGSVVALAGGYGNYRSIDNGMTWEPFTLDDESDPVLAITSCGDALLAGTTARSGGSIYRSVDGARSWSRVSQHFNGVYGFTVSQGKALALVYGSSFGFTRPYRSLDCGATWEEMPGAFAEETISHATYHGADLIAVGTMNIFRSTDDGMTWRPVGNGLAGKPITALASSGNALVAGTDRSSSEPALYRSTDTGATWTPVQGDFGSARIVALTVEGGDLFAATATAIYRSADHGATWSILSPAPYGRTFSTLMVRGSTVYAGTPENGVFRASVPAGVKMNDIEKDVATIAPNPTRDRSTLTYVVTKRAHVTIEIFNTFGERVARIVDRDEEPGEQSASIELGDRPQGHYLCRLTIGDAVVVLPIKLMR